MVELSFPVQKSSEISPTDFDKQLRADLLATFPQRSVPGTLDIERARAAGACPLLDTHTLSSPNVNKNQVTKFWMRKTSRTLYSRVMLGLQLPGRYYFLTLTSSPESPSLERSWRKFRQWLHLHRPGIAFCFVITDEGHGVIHIVLRLKPRMKNLKFAEIQEYWQRIHKAKQVRIERVGKAKNLANYFADQRKLKKMGSEMSWQDYIVRWKYSPGWLPRGFIKRFGRLWLDLIDVPEGIRDSEVRIAINRAYEADKKELKKK